jgi:hypothetical protein
MTNLIALSHEEETPKQNGSKSLSRNSP